jgi:tetrahydromethanopterin S-methyltransferase subunit G
MLINSSIGLLYGLAVILCVRMVIVFLLLTSCNLYPDPNCG